MDIGPARTAHGDFSDPSAVPIKRTIALLPRAGPHDETSRRFLTRAGWRANITAAAQHRNCRHSAK